MLTVKPTFVGSREQMVERARAGSLEETLERLERCSADAGLIAIATICLAADANKRFPDADTVAMKLRVYLDSVQERLKQAEVERARAERRRFVRTPRSVTVSYGRISRWT